MNLNFTLGLDKDGLPASSTVALEISVETDKLQIMNSNATTLSIHTAVMVQIFPLFSYA